MKIRLFDKKNLIGGIAILALSGFGSISLAGYVDTAYGGTTYDCAGDSLMIRDSSFDLYMSSDFNGNGLPDIGLKPKFNMRADERFYRLNESDSYLRYYRPESNMLYYNGSTTPGIPQNSSYQRVSQAWFKDAAYRVFEPEYFVKLEAPSTNIANNRISFMAHIDRTEGAYGNYQGSTDDTNSYYFFKISSVNYAGSEGVAGYEIPGLIYYYPARQKRLCINYDLHRCGDNIIDDEVFSFGTEGEETCDDGANNGTPGYCNDTCDGTVPTPAPTCDLDVDGNELTTTITLGDNVDIDWDISGTYTNSPQITVTPNTVTNLPYTVTTANGTRNVTPQSATTYTVSMTVSNAGGSNSCTAEIVVAPPVAPTCDLDVDGNEATTTITLGNNVDIDWDISGTYTNSPQITVTPNTVTNLPYTVTTANGTRNVTPQNAVTYTVNMTVSNAGGSNSCTAEIVVIPPAPTCTLTVDDPTLTLGDSTNVNWDVVGTYTNNPQITTTPNSITGLPYSIGTTANGNRAITPRAETSYTLSMTVTNAGGTDTCTTTVTTTDLVCPTTMTVSPTTVYFTDTTPLDFSWNSVGAATSVLLSGHGVNQNVTAVSTYQLTTYPQVTPLNYELVLSAGGQSITCPFDPVTVRRCGDGHLYEDGDGTREAGEEECDPGVDANDGCNATTCELEDPTCTLDAVPWSGALPLDVNFSGSVGNTTTNLWSDYVSLNYGDLSAINTVIDWTHQYTTVGVFTAALIVENNYAAAYNGTLPQMECEERITTSDNPASCGVNGAVSTSEINSGGWVVFTGHGINAVTYDFYVDGPDGRYITRNGSLPAGGELVGERVQLTQTGMFTGYFVFYNSVGDPITCDPFSVEVFVPTCIDFEAEQVEGPATEGFAAPPVFSIDLYSGTVNFHCNGQHYTDGQISLDPPHGNLNTSPYTNPYVPSSIANDHAEHEFGYTWYFDEKLLDAVGNKTFVGECILSDSYGNSVTCVAEPAVIVKRPSDIQLSKRHYKNNTPHMGVTDPSWTQNSPFLSHPLSYRLLHYKIELDNKSVNNETNLHMIDTLPEGMSLESYTVVPSRLDSFFVQGITSDGKNYFGLSGFNLLTSEKKVVVNFTGRVDELRNFATMKDEEGTRGYVYHNISELRGGTLKESTFSSVTDLLILDEATCDIFESETIINSGGTLTFTGRGQGVTGYEFILEKLNDDGSVQKVVYTSGSNNYIDGTIVVFNVLVDEVGIYRARLTFKNAFGDVEECTVREIEVVIPECINFEAEQVHDVVPSGLKSSALGDDSIFSIDLYSGEVSFYCVGEHYDSGHIELIPDHTLLTPNPYTVSFTNDHLEHMFAHNWFFDENLLDPLGSENKTFTSECVLEDEFGNRVSCPQIPRVIVKRPSSIEMQKRHLKEGDQRWPGIPDPSWTQNSEFLEHPSDTEHLHYRITFENKTNIQENNLYLYDLLPTGIQLDTNVDIVPPSLASNFFYGTVGGRDYIKLSGFSLLGFQTGHIAFTGNIVSLENLKTLSDGRTGYVYHNIVSLTGGGLGVTGTFSSVTDVLIASPFLTLDKENMHPMDMYAIGDLVTFELSFTNPRDDEVTNVTVGDMLPPSLEYVDSSISFIDGSQIVPTPSLFTGVGDRAIYSNITLPAHSSGIMILTGRVRTAGCANDNISNLNTGFVDLNTRFQDEDTATYICATGVVLEKYQSVNAGVFTSAVVMVEPYDYLAYKVIFTNVGGATASNISIADLFPQNINFITGTVSISSALPLVRSTIGGREYVETSLFNLAGGTSGFLLITGQVGPSFDGTREYRNTANLDGDLSNEVIAILTGNGPRIGITKELTQPGVSHYSGSEVGFRITVVNTGYSTVTGLEIRDTFPGSLDYNHAPIIVGLGSPTVREELIGGDLQIRLTNVTLAPRSTGYLYLTGTVDDVSCSSTWNGVTMSGEVIDGILFDFASFTCSPLPLIEKYQRSTGDFTTGTITVNPGGTIGYKLVFQNMGGDVTSGGIVVSDMLPAGITYVSSDIVVWSGGVDVSSSLSVGSSDTTIAGRDYVEYSGFDLNALQSGYLIITGQVSSDLAYTQYINTGYIEFFNPYATGVSNTVTAIRANISTMQIQKDVVDASGNVVTNPLYGYDSDIFFAITISNSGDAVSNIELVDLRPDPSENCIDYVGRSPTGTFTKSTSALVRSYVGTLDQGDSATLYLSGYIASGADCLGTYVNTGIMSFDLDGQHFTGYEDDAWFQVVDTSVLIRKTATASSLELGSKIGFKLYFENQGNMDVSNFVVSDLLPRTVDYTLTPSSWDSFCPNCPSSCRFSALGSDRTSYTGYVEHSWEYSCDFTPGLTGYIMFTGTVVR